MCKPVLLMLLMLTAQAALGQHAGYKPVENAAGFKAHFAAASQKINTIKCDFVQEKELSMLAEKIISRGKFLFKKENAVRMEYMQPFQYLMIINGSRIYIRDSQKENRISAKSGKLFEQINKTMMDCVNGSALSSADFTVKIFENNESYLAELSPVNRDMKKLFQNINLIIARKDYAVTSIEMREPSGDNTIISFINREMNVTLSDALFAVN